MIKRVILMGVLMLSALSMSAQTVHEQREEAKRTEYRNKIGIDYSMPDFSTSRIDGKVIGTRLAKMLQLLQNRCDNHEYKARLSYIQCEQLENLRYGEIEKFSITNISKTGDVITVSAKTKLAKNAANIKTAEMVLVFDKGLSESNTVNDFFSELGKYIKE